MHLTEGVKNNIAEGVQAADSGSGKKMSGTSFSRDSVRLRRQHPVSSRPPRIRQALHSVSGTQSVSAVNKKRAPVHSWHGYDESDSLELGATGGLLSAVDDDAQNFRPLIHHQRHNLKSRFQLIKTLGEGTYGKVKLAMDKASGELVAIKYIKKTKIQEDSDMVRIRREIQILSNLKHEHIVNIREVFEKKDKIVLVMDYAQGGELYEYLNKMGKLSELEARRIFRQIVSAVHYCHAHGIVHRDLKLENIILDDQGNVKIADFGLSNYYSFSTMLDTFCGSPLYASPEIVNGKPYYGPEVDVWSLGVVLYTLVYGAMPFESNNLVSLKQHISQGDYRQPYKPSDAAGLIRHMLTVTPSRRASMEDALKHWWLNLGHSLMPNKQPYQLEEEIYKTGPLPVTIIHQRNQSSLSSDSDLELDFRPISVSSSSPASTREIEEDLNIDNLPPAVLDILKGCSSRLLTSLINRDKISTGFDDTKTDLTVQQTEKTVPEISRSIFDSEKKPRRGILKRKGKFSGGDSGCEIHEEIPCDENLPKSGHLPRRLPSFRDETYGIFSSRHRATQLLDTVEISSIQESIWNRSDIVHQPSLQQDNDHIISNSLSVSQKPRETVSTVPITTPYNCVTPSLSSPCAPVRKIPTVITTDSETSVNNIQSKSNRTKESEKSETFSRNNTTSSSPALKIQSFELSNTTCTNTDPEHNPSKSTIIRRPKSILKNGKMDEAKNRLSISSIGSNSSADILDLSYDSGDCDHFVNLGSTSNPSLDWNQLSSGATSDVDLLESFDDLSVDDVSYNLQPVGLVDQQTSMLYQLVRDGRNSLSQ